MSSILVRGDVSLVRAYNKCFQVRQLQICDIDYVVVSILRAQSKCKLPGGEYGMPFQWRQVVGTQVMRQL